MMIYKDDPYWWQARRECVNNDLYLRIISCILITITIRTTHIGGKPGGNVTEP